MTSFNPYHSFIQYSSGICWIRLQNEFNPNRILLKGYRLGQPEREGHFHGTNHTAGSFDGWVHIGQWSLNTIPQHLSSTRKEKSISIFLHPASCSDTVLFIFFLRNLKILSMVPSYASHNPLKSIAPNTHNYLFILFVHFYIKPIIITTFNIIII